MNKTGEGTNKENLSKYGKIYSKKERTKIEVYPDGSISNEYYLKIVLLKFLNRKVEVKICY